MPNALHTSIDLLPQLSFGVCLVSPFYKRETWNAEPCQGTQLELGFKLRSI